MKKILIKFWLLIQTRGVRYDDFWSWTIKRGRSAFGEILLYQLQFWLHRINKLYNATSIHISVNSAVELLLRDTALIRNQKSTGCQLNVSFTRCSEVRFFFNLHEKVCLTVPDNRTKLSFALIRSKHTRIMYRLSWLSKMKVNSWDKRIGAWIVDARRS